MLKLKTTVAASLALWAIGGIIACSNLHTPTAVAADQGEGLPLHKNWKLVWEDDFSKDKEVDKTKWNFVVKGDGFGNNEQEFYTDRKDNVKIEDGQLVITGIKEKYRGKPYTSAKLTTEGKFSIKYGRIEACIKSPKPQKGTWPAFWMMPQDNKYGGWPKSGEIDIMEMVNDCKTLYGTCHFGGNGHKQAGATTKLPDGKAFPEEFHVYAVEWEEKEIRWYCDGKFYGKINDWSTSAAYPAPFNQRFYVILNFAIGGQWPGNPNMDSTFPQEMRVKYVRAYQSSDQTGK